MNTTESTADFINMVLSSRSAQTARTYSNALNLFVSTLPDEGNTPAADLGIQHVKTYLERLKELSPATERLYTTAANRFYHYLVAEEIITINLALLAQTIKTRTRRQGKRLPKFPKKDIEALIEHAADHFGIDPPTRCTDGQRRDAAFILVLADTGLRVSEACNLVCSDIDWKNQTAVIIGKGDKQAVVRFSSRSIEAILYYIHRLGNCENDDTPLFMRHNNGNREANAAISTATGRQIIKRQARALLGERKSKTITPHSFRHYFVTMVWQKSGGNIKLAQELARHTNIQMTQRYTHLSDSELDAGYKNIFDD